MQDKINAVIVDDEELAREALKMTLSDFPQIEIIGECSNGFEAVNSIKKLNPDLVFLDIQMPKINGFDVLELLGDDAPDTIFVTAYDEYAVKAFEAHALDYLLKPVSKERMAQALEHFAEYSNRNQKPAFKNLINQRFDDSKPLSRILVREKSKVHIIPVEKIPYIEAQDDYVLIHTIDNSFMKHERLSNLEINLDAQSFQRVHRSFILNLSHIDRIETYSKDSKIAKLRDGSTLPISRAGYERLMQFL